MGELLINATNLLQNLLLKAEQYPNIPENYMKYLQFAPVFLIFFILVLLLKPIIARIAQKVNAIDLPAQMRVEKLNPYDQTQGIKAIHKTPTPLLGGVAVLLPLLLSIPLLITNNELVIPFLTAGVILLIIGILDDVYNLPAPIQLAGQLVASTVIAISAIDIPFINNPLGGTFNLNWWQIDGNILDITLRLILPGDLLLIFWIMLCTNAVKWVGGIGGLLESNMIVAYLMMFVLGIRAESLLVTYTSIALAGGIAGGWIFDFPPAKIFTGSTGKTMYGFIIAVLALVNGAKVAATIIILAIPLIDALYVIIHRYRTYKPKNFIELMRINGPMHLHHQLYNMNLTPPQILLVETTIAVFFGVVAVLTTGAYKFFFLLFILFVTLLGIVILNKKAQKKKEEEAKRVSQESPESKYSY